jgi:hypothetical protein
MRVVYNDIIPFGGFRAMMLFGVIFARKKYRPLSAVVINHEHIHAAQAKACGGYLRFYWLYIRMWMKYGYRDNPFEIQAYAHERDLGYPEDENFTIIWNKDETE